MSTSDTGSSSSLSSDDFRAGRDYLPDEAFGLVDGSYGPPSDLIPEDEWHGLMCLPTDVLLRSSENHGTPLAQMYRLWGAWVEALPIEVERAPFMHSAGWDAADDFQASTFTAAHGYYRQGMATLRSALDGLAIAASFSVRQNKAGLDKWLSGQAEPPKFGNARDLLKPTLGDDVTVVLAKLYKDMSGYIHSQHDSTNVAMWGGSNGPVWEPSSLRKVYESFRDIMSMGFVLLSAGWPEFAIPNEMWPLFEQPGGAWAGVSRDDLKRRFGSSQ